MKFSQIQRGKRAERRASFPSLGDDGAIIEAEFVCVPLGGHEEAEALSFAESYAREHGIKSPSPGMPLYDLGMQIKTLELSMLDVDSPPSARLRFFGSTKEVESLPRETIVYLFAIVDDWQDQCSPMSHKINDDSLYATIHKLGTGGPDAERFFDSCGPGLRRIFTLSMARLLVTLLGPKSSPSGSTGESGTSDSSDNTTTDPSAPPQ